MGMPDFSPLGYFKELHLLPRVIFTLGGGIAVASFFVRSQNLVMGLMGVALPRVPGRRAEFGDGLRLERIQPALSSSFLRPRNHSVDRRFSGFCRYLLSRASLLPLWNSPRDTEPVQSVR